MQTSRLLRPLAVAGLVALSFGALSAVAPSLASATTPTTNNIVNAAYAKKLGFPKVLVAAKSTSNTGQKNCSKASKAVYESKDAKIGMVTEVLICSKSSAAAAFIKEAKSQSTTDKTFHLSKALGTTAFATSAEAPQYTVAWQHGSKVGVVAIDTDIPASESESSPEAGTFTVITPAQNKLLTALAAYQNGLMSK